MIKRLKIDRFGGISDFEMSFSSGINLIYGENESGKSTICTFLKAVIYGFPQNRKSGILDNEKKKYTPLYGEEFGGMTQLLLKDESELEIHRSFSGRGSLSIFDPETSQRLKDLEEETGEKLFGMPIGSFEKTAFIGQNAYTVKKDEELLNRLYNLSSTMREDMSAAGAIKRLEELRKHYQTARKTGLIPELEDEFLNLADKIYDAKKKEEEMAEKLFLQEDLRAQIKECEEKKAGILEKISLREKKEIQKNRELIESANSEYEHERSSYQEEAAELRGITHKDLENFEMQGRQLATKALLLDEKRRGHRALSQKASDAGEQVVHVEPVINAYAEIEKCRRSLYETEGKRRRLETDRNLEKISEEKAPAAEPGPATEAPKRKGYEFYKYILFGLFAISVLSFLFMGFRNPFDFSEGPEQLRFILPYLFLLATCAFAAFMINDEMRAKKEQVKVSAPEPESTFEGQIKAFLAEEERLKNAFMLILKDTGFKTFEELSESTKLAQKLMDKYQLMKEEESLSASELFKMESELENAWKGVITELEHFAGGEISVNNAPDIITTLRHKYIELEKRQIAMDAKKKRMSDLLGGKNIEDFRELWENDLHIDDNDIPEEGILREELSSLEEKTLGLSKREAYLEAELLNGNQISSKELELKQAIVQQKLSDATKAYNAVLIAINGIESASESLLRSFTPRVNAVAGDYLSLFTDGKYEKLYLDPEFKVLVGEKGRPPYEMEYLSFGTMDQVYLSLRLAMLSMLSDGLCEMPLILDDAFSQFDDIRLSKVADIINEVAKKRQVLWFTCQKRDGEIVSDFENVKMFSIK